MVQKQVQVRNMALSKFIGHLRLFLYFSFTAVIFVLSFSPLLLDLYFVVESHDLVLYLLFPIQIIVLYLVGIFMFTVIHSKIVVPLTLPPLKPGYYDRHDIEAKLQGVRLYSDKIVQHLLRPLNFIPFVNQKYLIGFFCKFYGLKIGRNCYLTTTLHFDSALLEIGDNCFIGLDAVISCHITEKNRFYINKVIIGDNVTIGGKAIIAPGVVIEDDALIGAHTFVPKNVRIGKNQIYVATKPRLLQKKTTDFDITDNSISSKDQLNKTVT